MSGRRDDRGLGLGGAHLIVGVVGIVAIGVVVRLVVGLLVIVRPLLVLRRTHLDFVSEIINGALELVEAAL
jgi:hypothetical protein